MPIKKIDSSRYIVDLKEPLIKRKDWVKYLVLVNWHTKELGEALQQKLDARFGKLLEEQLENYLAGKKPPAAISTAILNIADQHLSGGEITLRTGDYIALQSYFKSVK